MHHGAGVEAPVHAEVQPELRGGLELAVHEGAVEIHDAHLLGPELGQHRARWVTPPPGRSRRALRFPAVPSTSPSAASERAAVGHLLALRASGSPRRP